MPRYGNKHGNSGVIAYEVGKDFIIVKFNDGNYMYDYNSAGPTAIETMKILARKGKGLSTYISRHVKDKYKKKIE